MADQTLAQLVRSKYPGVYDKLSDQELETKVRAKFPGGYDKVPSTAAPDNGRTGGLAVGTAAAAVPLAAKGAMELATNPNVPKMAATAGRVLGGIAPVVIGAKEGGIEGSLIGAASSARGAWLGGRTGWFTGKLAQSMASPAAKVLGKAAPLANAVAIASIPFAVHDAAKLVGASPQSIGMRRDAALAEFVSSAITKTKEFIANGMTPSKAAMAASDGKPSVFAAIISHFMKSGGVK